jgi:hypothetical protein
VDSVLNGDRSNGTILAYGQTGAGKSHTINVSIVPNAMQHILRRAAAEAAAAADSPGGCSTPWAIHCSYVEIYNEKLYDLLGEVEQLRIKQQRHEADNSTSVFVEGVTKVGGRVGGVQRIARGRLINVVVGTLLLRFSCMS